MQRRHQIIQSRYALPGYRGQWQLPVKPISDGLLLRFVCGDWYSNDPRNPRWIGFPLGRVSRRDVSNREHRQQIEAVLASAVARRVVVIIKRRGSPLRYYAPPIAVEPGQEIIVDEIVPPPPVKFSPAPKPGRPRKVEQLPAVVVPEPPPRPPELSIRHAVINDLRRSPNAFMLLSWLKVEYPDGKTFDLKMLDVARRMDWATPRVVAALCELLRRDYLYARGQFQVNAGFDGSYSWHASRHSWRHLTKAEREASRLEAM
jgi:hypothetical protein